MRTITKSTNSPPCLAQQPHHQTWHNFMHTPCHEVVVDALLEEQLYLCCYCEWEVAETNAHVEHIVPQRTGRVVYSYSNLTASCNGGVGENRHCGHRKAGDYDAQQFCSPHDVGTANLFRYLSDGHIEPAPALNDAKRARADYMIRLLNLDCPRLVGSRRRHAHVLINTLGNKPTAKILDWAVDYYLKPDAGRLKQFHTLSRKLLRK